MKIVYLDSYPLADMDCSPISILGDYVEYATTEASDVIKRSKDAEILIVNKVILDRNILEQLPVLQLICVSATGVNNVDIEYAKSRNIEVRNVPAYSTNSVAESTFAYALALLRNIVYYDRYVKSGDYSHSGLCFHTVEAISEIHGKRWGIIGMGSIGRRVAEIATCFGADVCYYSTSGGNLDAGYAHKSLRELLVDSDIVSIHSPLNTLTDNLIGYEELKLMKATSILINVARGRIVNERDLADALNDNLIYGAALDVFECEPLRNDNPLLDVKCINRLILAPHNGWASKEARQLLIDKIVENIKSFLP